MISKFLIDEIGMTAFFARNSMPKITSKSDALICLVLSQVPIFTCTYLSSPMVANALKLTAFIRPISFSSLSLS